MAGEVASTITITQSNVSIIGEGTSKPIIQGGGSWVTGFEIANGAINVTIDNFEITGFTPEAYAIIISGANTFIQNCYIHYNDTGILTINGDISETIKIRNNLLELNMTGIFVASYWDDKVAIYENDIYNNETGIWLQYGSNTTIEKNKIRNNNTGIYMTMGDSMVTAIIKNNLIYGNQSMGIYAEGTAYIYHNTIDGQGVDNDIGIFFDYYATQVDAKYNIITVDSIPVFKKGIMLLVRLWIITTCGTTTSIMTAFLLVPMISPKTLSTIIL